MNLKLLTGLLLLILALGSCLYTDMGYTFDMFGEVDAEGTWRITDPNPLYHSDIYIQDDLAIRCVESLKRGNPSQDIWWQITPDSLVIRAGDFVAVDTLAQKIYFCANKDLYSCDYDGQHLVNHTPDAERIFLKPVLCEDNRHISLLSITYVNYGGSLNLLDLETGEIEYLELNEAATWGRYDCQRDRFFYISKFGRLCSVARDGSDRIVHFSGFLDQASYCSSFDGRYLGLWVWGYMYGIVYDCLTDEILQIDDVNYMAINPLKAELTYTHDEGDWAVLRRRDLISGEQIVIHNGGLSGDDYISAYPYFLYRLDGKKLVFKASRHTIVQEGPYGKRIAGATF